jgi:hypothetical protein
MSNHPKEADGCTINQGFGFSANPSYHSAGYLGHTGRDTSCGFGSDITSPVDGIVFATYQPERPARDGYRAVYILTRTALEWFEFSIGHMHTVDVKVGQRVKKGDKLGTEGNHGVVYQGGQLITLAMQAAGDTRGSHRHNQKRPVIERAKRTKATALTNSKGLYRSEAGNYWEYALPDNGYAGCVDYTLPLFNRDLYFGRSGYDVVLLQRALGMPPELQTGFYGPKTMASLGEWQKANGITPFAGYCGAITRKLLNTRYLPME